MTTAPAAESPRDVVLDALAAILAIDQGRMADADALAASYDRCGEVDRLLSALAAVSLAAVRYSATVSGIPVERLLAGVAANVRNQES